MVPQVNRSLMPTVAMNEYHKHQGCLMLLKILHLLTDLLKVFSVILWNSKNNFGRTFCSKMPHVEDLNMKSCGSYLKTLFDRIGYIMTLVIQF
ncbi:hypothetical protein K7X08_000456 [Anisodus acutangulus]|uniref:Uncharacterized protein n=1 Tax=Anisodus acutangulus TaxID=402998 RepID=A0A9Q1M6R4_9SOLA|nr:hypothetical protein K7X08_000456 [Anisodus acutangulus]